MIDLAAIRRSLDAAVRGADVDRLGDLAGLLETARLGVWARMTAPPSPPPIARLVTAEELEAAHQVPASWFRAAARDGIIPCVRHGAHVRFDADAVREALERSPALRRRSRKADHRITETVEPQKGCNGKGPLPDCYHAEAANGAENRTGVHHG